MPKNVMKLLPKVANNPRFDFDLSHRHLLTLNFGEIVPATFLEFVPDDYIEMRVSDLFRAIPMVTSPFLRAKQHIDVWAVPYDYLWSNFSGFITQKSQPTSSALKGQAFIPHANRFVLSSVINSSNTDTDIVGRSWSAGARKLFDLCGYGRLDASGSADVHPEVNLWRIAAYNKIWYDEYRQKYFDKGYRFIDDGEEDSPASLAWNFDDLDCTNSTNSSIHNGTLPFARIKEMFQMRYRLWKKDLFTGGMPSQQFGNVSTVSSSFSGSLGTDLNRWSTYAGSALLGNTNVTTNNAGSNLYVDNSAAVHTHEINGQSVFDILALRKSQAVQIWRERALTAGNRISDNLKSHYGSSAEYNDHRASFLGSVDAPLNISDIDATAQTGEGTNQGLGDVAGKGLSSLDERVFKFKAHTFGVIVVVVSLLPEAEYESQGTDRMNQLLEWEDYFIPETQNTGLEAISSQTFYNTQIGVARNISYGPRYWGYKTKLDKCFSGFWSNQPFAPWASPKTDVTTALASGSAILPLSTLYVNPALYNRNFAVDVDNSEQFICDMYFDVSAVRGMTPSGIPND